MREQLAHLLEMSQLPHVVVRIVLRAIGYHMGLDGAFKTMSVTPEGDVAYTEASEGGADWYWTPKGSPGLHYGSSRSGRMPWVGPLAESGSQKHWSP